MDLPSTALVTTSLVLGVHGLLALAGLDFIVSGPALTPGQCFAAAGVCLIRHLARRNWR